jgi:hypothetical protein
LATRDYQTPPSKAETFFAFLRQTSDARREELEELEMLEIEMTGIHKLLGLAGADKEDIKRMEEIREKITRIERRIGRQHPQPEE